MPYSLKNMPKLPKGFIPVVLSPFTEQGKLDDATLLKLCAWYQEAGAVGLFANCLSSEMYELEKEEALHALSIIKSHFPNLALLATGNLGPTWEEKVDFSKALVDLGVDVVVMANSNFLTESSSEQALCDSIMNFMDQVTGVDMGLYECPIPHKRLIHMESLRQICQGGRLRYFKDTSLNAEVLAERQRMGEPHGLQIYDAYMGHVSKSLQAGAHGLSCIQGNYYPALMAWLCQAPSPEAMALAQSFLNKHFDLMHQIYPISAKYHLSKGPLAFSLHTRRQVGTWTPAQAQALDGMDRDYRELAEHLGISSKIG